MAGVLSVSWLGVIFAEEAGSRIQEEGKGKSTGQVYDVGQISMLL